MLRGGTLALVALLAACGSADSAPDVASDSGLVSFHLLSDGSSNAMRVEAEGETLLVDSETDITQDCFTNVASGTNPSGSGDPVLHFTFDSDCAERFGQMTSDNIGKRFVVMVEGEHAASPFIRSPILSGQGYIEFADDVDATALAGRVAERAGLEEN